MSIVMADAIEAGLALSFVDCAVNDDNGCTTDRVVSIHVPGLTLTAIPMRGVHFRALPRAIRVSRRTWKATHLASLVGNIFWERFGMDACRTAALLHYLRASRLFLLDGGCVELCDWWDSKVHVSDTHKVEALLIDAVKNADL